MTEAQLYRIDWSAEADRNMGQIPEKVRPVLLGLIYGPLAENPYRLGKPMFDAFEGLHTTRRGDYRVIYRIDAESRVITIQRAGHRSKVYRGK